MHAETLNWNYCHPRGLFTSLGIYIDSECLLRLRTTRKNVLNQSLVYYVERIDVIHRVLLNYVNSINTVGPGLN